MKNKVVFDMKKIGIVILFVFSCLAGMTQHISKGKYKELVDYVNCRYVATYIESIKAIPDEKENYEKFEIKIKKRIDCDIDDPLESEELSELLSENGWAITDSNLVQKIIKNKEFYDENLDNKRLIELIVSTDNLSTTFKNILDKEKKILKDEITKSLEPGKNSVPEKPSYLLLIIGISSLVALLALAIFVWVRTKRNRIIITVLGSQRIRNEFSKHHEFDIIKTGIQPDNKLSLQLSEIEKRIGRLEVELENFRNQTKQKNEDTGLDFPPSIPENTIVKYLKTAPNGIFNNVFDIPTGCYFRLYDINGEIAKFEFCGNFDEAIANKSAIFDDTSEPFDPPKNSTSIFTESPGVAFFADGKWKVKDKAVIKFK